MTFTRICLLALLVLPALLRAQEENPPTNLPKWIAAVFYDVSLCGRETPELTRLLQALAQDAPDASGPAAYEKLTNVLTQHVTAFGIPNAGGCHDAWGSVNPEIFLKNAKEQSIPIELQRRLVQAISQTSKEPRYAADWNYRLAEQIGLGKPEAADLEDAAIHLYEKGYETTLGEERNASYQALLKLKNRQPRPRIVFLKGGVPDRSMDMDCDYSSLRTDWPADDIRNLTLLLEFSGQDILLLEKNDATDKRRRRDALQNLLAQAPTRSWLGSALYDDLQQFLREQFVASLQRKEEQAEALLDKIQAHFELVKRFD